MGGEKVKNFILTDNYMTTILVRVGWFKEGPRANLVEVALEKQDAKK